MRSMKQCFHVLSIYRTDAIPVSNLELMSLLCGGFRYSHRRFLHCKAVDGVPAKDAGDLYIRYAKLEEKYGLVRHAASVLDRACAAVEETERLDMFRLYIAKVNDARRLSK